MGLFSTWTPLKDITNAVTSVVGSVSNLTTSTLTSAAPVLNTSGATAFAGAAGAALTGGSAAGTTSLASAFLPKPTTTSPSVGSGSNVNVEATLWNKLINIYKLKPTTLKDSLTGKEYMNYDLDSTGAKQIDYVTLAIKASVLLFGIILIHDYIFTPKNKKNKRWLFGKK